MGQLLSCVKGKKREVASPWLDDSRGKIGTEASIHSQLKLTDKAFGDGSAGTVW